MHEPAFVALACSLGPVVYALMGLLTGVLVVKLLDYKGDDPEENFVLGLLAFAWPVALLGFLVVGAGKLMAKLGDG